MSTWTQLQGPRTPETLSIRSARWRCTSLEISNRFKRQNSCAGVERAHGLSAVDRQQCPRSWKEAGRGHQVLFGHCQMSKIIVIIVKIIVIIVTNVINDDPQSLAMMMMSYQTSMINIIINWERFGSQVGWSAETRQWEAAEVDAGMKFCSIHHMLQCCDYLWTNISRVSEWSTKYPNNIWTNTWLNEATNA